MPDCRHCDASFEEDDAYAEHLQAEHADDLGTIDRRRIETHASSREWSVPRAPLVLGIVLVAGIAFLGLVWVTLSGGKTGGTVDAERQPSAVGSVHYHGTIEMSVNGEQVDFGRERYQFQDDAFHFESGEGTRWHAHAEGVTLEYAMATLGIEVTADTVTYEGTTYRDSDQGTSVTVTVDGDPVTPSEYVLQEGDHVRIVVEQQ